MAGKDRPAFLVQGRYTEGLVGLSDKQLQQCSGWLQETKGQCPMCAHATVTHMCCSINLPHTQKHMHALYHCHHSL